MPELGTPGSIGMDAPTHKPVALTCHSGVEGVLNHFNQEERPAMKITTVGIDLAKNVFQVHGVNEHGKTVLRKQLKRDQVVAFFANIPQCLIGKDEQRQ